MAKSKKELAADWYNKNKKRILAQQTAYRASKKKDAPVKAKKPRKRKYEGVAPSETREAKREYNRRWREKNIDAIKKKQRESYQKHYEENREKILARQNELKKKRQQAKIIRRQQKTDWARKKKEQENQAKLEAYNKEFGYE